ncbi:PREDICTED: pentatricopeptide repeat-containing protein At5g48910-like [Nelumbo nucifera]|uniref:Pentatricopeptide repeat-containing protein At5g48910-like n=2 Tax=Nelumbo nucifera TaxID=4432 RepID=A0A822ZQY1_NELNU|nr:PREDICTED: pentatricopeptide repeat-containing protein At5g48910-like [Nelumbo nucifera]DAD45346.1 TPA_asm: hypothetical protein HUJ06_003576 [Nelumbo nucifera]
MALESILPWNTSSFPSLPPPLLPLLHRCTTVKEVQQFHAQTIKTGLFQYDPTVATKLVESCCSSFQSSSPKSGDVDYTLSVFDYTIEPSSFLYNTLIRACTQVDQPEQAFLLFYEMLHDLAPDKFTFPFVLKSCAQLASIEEGEQVHCFVLKTDFASDLFVQNSLIHMYARCRKIRSARGVFEGISGRNIVSWNSMIGGFLKSGDIESACKLFDEMPQRNLVSWNSMISGYARESLPYEALSLVAELQVSGLRPDESTLVSAISAISDLGILSLGKRVHGYIIRHELSLNGVLGASLIDMYSKCGSIHHALKVFVGIQNRNVGHWTSIIVGFAVHGFAEAALQLFSQMQVSGVKPNYITFIGVLNACSHRGLVEEGLKHFNLMRSTYNIEPRIQHYGCLVDLLSRSGFLEEAKALIENMPMEPGSVIWGTLLSACRNHGNVEIGEVAALKLIQLMPDYGSGYVLLSNLYASSGRWEDFSAMRRVMGDRGVGKVPGVSWIEVDGEIHEFVVGDKIHPRRKEIYKMLNKIESEMRGHISYEPEQ